MFYIGIFIFIIFYTLSVFIVEVFCMMFLLLIALSFNVYSSESNGNQNIPKTYSGVKKGGQTNLQVRTSYPGYNGSVVRYKPNGLYCNNYGDIVGVAVVSPHYQGDTYDVKFILNKCFRKNNQPLKKVFMKFKYGGSQGYTLSSRELLTLLKGEETTDDPSYFSILCPHENCKNRGCSEKYNITYNRYKRASELFLHYKKEHSECIEVRESQAFKELKESVVKKNK